MAKYPHSDFPAAWFDEALKEALRHARAQGMDTYEYALMKCNYWKAYPWAPDCPPIFGKIAEVGETYEALIHRSAVRTSPPMREERNNREIEQVASRRRSGKLESIGSIIQKGGYLDRNPDAKGS